MKRLLVVFLFIFTAFIIYCELRYLANAEQQRQSRQHSSATRPRK
ncbi:MAG: hypothetical protein V1928_04760 [Parcubacteria group bacterium]